MFYPFCKLYVLLQSFYRYGEIEHKLRVHKGSEIWCWKYYYRLENLILLKIVPPYKHILYVIKVMPCEVFRAVLLVCGLSNLLLWSSLFNNIYHLNYSLHEMITMQWYFIVPFFPSGWYWDYIWSGCDHHQHSYGGRGLVARHCSWWKLWPFPF